MANGIPVHLGSKKVMRKERKPATCSMVSGDSDWVIIRGGCSKAKDDTFVRANETTKQGLLGIGLRDVVRGGLHFQRGLGARASGPNL